MSPPCTTCLISKYEELVALDFPAPLSNLQRLCQPSGEPVQDPLLALLAVSCCTFAVAGNLGSGDWNPTLFDEGPLLYLFIT